MPKCNYQAVVTDTEKSAALKLGRCEICSRTEDELQELGRELEVCGVEHYSDIASGEACSLTIPICTECHRKYHLNAQLHEVPCPYVARRSWEAFS